MIGLRRFWAAVLPRTPRELMFLAWGYAVGAILMAAIGMGLL